MGLTSWDDSPNGKIYKSDVIVAKNYVTQEGVGHRLEKYGDIGNNVEIFKK